MLVVEYIYEVIKAVGVHALRVVHAGLECVKPLVPRLARGYNAVEQRIAHIDKLNYFLRPAQTHRILYLGVRHCVGGGLQYIVPHVTVAVQRPAAEAVAVKADLLQLLSALHAQFGVRAALYYAEQQRLFIHAPGLAVVLLAAARAPAYRRVH